MTLGDCGKSAVNPGCYVVPDQTPELVRSQVEDHVKRMGYLIVHASPSAEERLAHRKIVQLEWESGYAGFRTPLDAEGPAAVMRVMQEALGEPILNTPTLGGSIPMSLFYDALHSPVVVLPIANYDNNQHASNENIRLRNLWAGVDIFSVLFADLGNKWK